MKKLFSLVVCSIIKIRNFALIYLFVFFMLLQEWRQSQQNSVNSNILKFHKSQIHLFRSIGISKLHNLKCIGILFANVLVMVCLRGVIMILFLYFFRFLGTFPIDTTKVSINRFIHICSIVFTASYGVNISHVM